MKTSRNPRVGVFLFECVSSILRIHCFKEVWTDVRQRSFQLDCVLYGN